MNPKHSLLAQVALTLAHFAAAPGAVVAGVPAPARPGDLLGSTGAVGDSLIAIDPATGAGTFRCPLGSFGPVTEIEFRDDGVLFGATAINRNTLITIDPDLCTETEVGVHLIGSLNGLEFVDGVLYGSAFGFMRFSELVIVDQDDATLTRVGPLVGYLPVRGLAWDGATMYGVGTPESAPRARSLRGNGPRPGDELFTIDLATGATTTIGPTGFAVIGGIEFGPDGRLYGGVGGQPTIGEGVPGGGELVIIDTVTGAATPVGPTGSPAISGLAFVPGLGPSVLEIPTASEVGLVLLALLLAAAGLVALRRS